MVPLQPFAEENESRHPREHHQHGHEEFQAHGRDYPHPGMPLGLGSEASLNVELVGAGIPDPEGKPEGKDSRPGGERVVRGPEEMNADDYLEMLKEAGVPVLLERPLVSVSMKDGRLISAALETGETVHAGMFVDATYEGDLLLAARVSYHVGREPAATYGESLGGQWQKISWRDVYQFCRLPISPYVEPGKPESGLLPEISSETPGKPGEGDYRVQAYNFRVQLSNE